MPQRPLKPCKHPFCPNLVRPPNKYCNNHQRYEKAIQREYDTRRGTRQERGYSDYYVRVVRPAKLASNPLCEICEAAGRVTAAEQVHHKDGNPNNNDWDNLQSVCIACHTEADIERRRKEKG